MNQMDFRPVLMANAAKQLTAPVRTDCNGECAAPDFLREIEERLAVEFGRAMNGDAPGWSSQDVSQHGNFGRISTEVRVNMIDARFAEPEHDLTSLGNIDEVNEERALRMIEGQPSCQRNSLQEADRSRN